MITSVIALIWPQLAAQKKYEFKTPGFPQASQKALQRVTAPGWLGTYGW